MASITSLIVVAILGAMVGGVIGALLMAMLQMGRYDRWP
jgi:hypothetical protein